MAGSLAIRVAALHTFPTRSKPGDPTRTTRANLHTATVFIWRNSHENDLAADAGKKLFGDSSKTGHAALKLQNVGAAKGDYYYLNR